MLRRRAHPALLAALCFTLLPLATAAPPQSNSNSSSISNSNAHPGPPSDRAVRSDRCDPTATRRPANPKSKIENRKSKIDRPSWGRVTGWVLDAATRKPVAGAEVALEVNGDFSGERKSSARTDAAGGFQARAPLGKISAKLDWGRVLTMHPISLVFSPRAVMMETRVVDVAQLNVRVRCPGYRPFLGTVRARDVDAERYTLLLEDVWLAPEGIALVSFSPDNVQHEMIERFSVTPPICKLGATLKVELVARLPLDRKFRYRALLTSNNPRLVQPDQPLKMGKPNPGEPNRVVFTRMVKLPKTTAEPYVELGFYLVRNAGVTLVEPETKALVQVVRTPEQQAAAEHVAEGYRLQRRAEYEAALARYQAAEQADPKWFLAPLFHGDLCLTLGRPAKAVESFRKLVALQPEDWDVARPRLVLGLLQSGQAAAAEAEVKDAEQKTRRVPPQIHLYRARIAALKGDFEAADKHLTRAAASIPIPPATTQEINLRRMRAAVAAQPDNPDVRLGYARVLESAGRLDEATAEIQRAIRLEPTDAWAYLDLAQVLRRAGRDEEALAPLTRSLQLNPQNSEARLVMADTLRAQGEYGRALETYAALAAPEPANTRVRHGHALTLLQAGEMGAARREFHAVINQARDKGEVEDKGIMLPWQSIYFGPKRRFVSGYSAPEGTADRVILECLDTLEQSPENALAWLNVGGALVQLGAPEMALDALRKAARLNPDLLEARYYRALALRQAGRRAEASRELDAVVAANPLHPRARLELARLLTEQGNSDLAQVQVLAHTRNYPDERRRQD